MIRETAIRAETVTKQLLAFSRKQPVRARPVELGKLVVGGRDDQLATPIVVHTVARAVVIERVLAGDAEPRLEAVLRIIDSGVNDLRVARAGLGADGVPALDDDDLASRHGEAARDGAAMAHQVHGAIGFTQEHVLHRYTQRLLAWRDDFGSESRWAARLGSMVAAAGADALWPTMTAG